MVISKPYFLFLQAKLVCMGTKATHITRQYAVFYVFCIYVYCILFLLYLLSVSLYVCMCLCVLVETLWCHIDELGHQRKTSGAT